MEARKYKPNSSIKFSSLLDTNYNPFKHYQYNIFVQKNLNRHMVHARFDFRCARRNWIQTSAGPTVNSDTRVVTKIKPFLVLDLSQFHTRQHLLEATFCMSEPRLQNGNITLTWPKSDAQKAVRDVTQDSARITKSRGQQRSLLIFQRSKFWHSGHISVVFVSCN